MSSEFLGKRYKLFSSENFDDFMKALGKCMYNRTRGLCHLSRLSEVHATSAVAGTRGENGAGKASSFQECSSEVFVFGDLDRDKGNRVI